MRESSYIARATDQRGCHSSSIHARARARSSSRLEARADLTTRVDVVLKLESFLSLCTRSPSSACPRTCLRAPYMHMCGAANTEARAEPTRQLLTWHSSDASGQSRQAAAPIWAGVGRRCCTRCEWAQAGMRAPRRGRERVGSGQDLQGAAGAVRRKQKVVGCHL